MYRPIFREQSATQVVREVLEPWHASLTFLSVEDEPLVSVHFWSPQCRTVLVQRTSDDDAVATWQALAEKGDVEIRLGVTNHMKGAADDVSILIYMSEASGRRATEKRVNHINHIRPGSSECFDVNHITRRAMVLSTATAKTSAGGDAEQSVKAAEGGVTSETTYLNVCVFPRRLPGARRHRRWRRGARWVAATRIVQTVPVVAKLVADAPETSKASSAVADDETATPSSTRLSSEPAFVFPAAEPRAGEGFDMSWQPVSAQTSSCVADTKSDGGSLSFDFGEHIDSSAASSSSASSSCFTSDGFSFGSSAADQGLPARSGASFGFLDDSFSGFGATQLLSGSSTNSFSFKQSRAAASFDLGGFDGGGSLFGACSSGGFSFGAAPTLVERSKAGKVVDGARGVLCGAVDCDLEFDDWYKSEPCVIGLSVVSETGAAWQPEPSDEERLADGESYLAQLGSTTKPDSAFCIVCDAATASRVTSQPCAHTRRCCVDCVDALPRDCPAFFEPVRLRTF